MAHNPLAPSELFSHVQDAPDFHVPRFMTSEEAHGHIAIPQPFALEQPLWEARTGNELIDSMIQPFDLKLTKFMVLEVVAAVIVAVLFIWVAARMRGGDRPRGRLWNLLEAFLLFFRDQIARPYIGSHAGDRFVPLLWTMFFFILTCNLLGMFPWMGSPTGSLSVTAALALVAFATTIGAGVKQLGFVGFWKAQVPHLDVPGILKLVLVPMIFAIEVMGLVIKHFVLAVRLLANMMAGHVVLAVIVAFIGVATGPLWYAVMPASVLGATALSLLELFVAFLQAYIFVFLAALFIGMAVHPH
jgi:F-type H+-transporting ATPase subunit a